MLKIEEQPTTNTTAKAEEGKATSKPAAKADNKTVVAVLVALVVIAAVVAAFIWNGANKNTAGDGLPTEEETAEVVTEIQKIMVLPDETPSMATVLDITKLSDQPFFAKAANGDKLLLYTQAQKAILYRPDTKQIVEVMPLIMDNNGGTTAGSEGMDGAVPVPQIEGTEMAPSTETEAGGEAEAN